MSKTPVDPNHIEKLKIWATSIREKSSAPTNSVVENQLPTYTVLTHPLSSLSNTLAQYCSIF